MCKELRVELTTRYLCTYAVHMSPPLSGSSAPQCFECGNAVKLHNGMMFNFYRALPHIVIVPYICTMSAVLCAYEGAASEYIKVHDVYKPVHLATAELY